MIIGFRESVISRPEWAGMVKFRPFPGEDNREVASTPASFVFAVAPSLLIISDIPKIACAV